MGLLADKHRDAVEREALDPTIPIVFGTGAEAESGVVGEWYAFPGRATTNKFRYALWLMAERLEGDVNAYAAVMSIESGFNPAATNPGSNATGLIQFMPSTAKQLGTSVDALRGMSAIQQLAYVEKFYAKAKGVTDPGTLYMLTFLPAFAYSDDSKVLGEKNGTDVLAGGLTTGKVYAANPGFDGDKDGIYTVGDVKNLARGRYNAAKAKGAVPITVEDISESGGSAGGGGGLLLVFGLGLAGFAAYKVLG